MSDVKFTDNSGEVLSAFDKGMRNALTAIGLTAEAHAKEILTQTVYTGDKPYPLTGRLRNSITWATQQNEGTTHTYSDDNQESYSQDRPQNIGDNEVIIGTAVEYAAGIEFGTHRKAGAVHFLKRAATEYSDEYKRLAKDAFENV